MDKRIVNLLRLYNKLEKRFSVVDDSANYAELVTAATSQNYPVQRWFHFKEGFSLDLLEHLIIDWNIETNSIRRVLDPFCGTGTTLLSVQKLAKKLGRRDMQAVGLERNPFLHFVAQTKLQWHSFNVRQFSDKTTNLLNGYPKPIPRKLPELSTFKRRDVYKIDTLRKLLGVKGAIDNIGQAEREILLLGYASVLEDLSGTRKDGRAIRIVHNKRCPEINDALRSAWSEITSDINQASIFFSPIKTQVLFGDGRTLCIDGKEKTTLKKFDLILYSPPYLNNIDYTEVYKIELWLCGFVDNRSDFRELRYKTFRSHPSVRFPDPITIAQDKRLRKVDQALDTLINSLPQDNDFKWRSNMFRGYFDDMYQSLKSQLNVLKPGGWAFCVVGNSLHGSSNEPEIRIPVASDLIIALIAEAIGLEVKSISVARHLKRRAPDGHFLRESIIVMRKPV
jgi:DNA modification methylase